MRVGDVDSAMHALSQEFRCQFYGGQNLSLLKANYDSYMKLITKYSIELATHAVLRKININELIGIVDDNPFSVLEGAFCNEAELMASAKVTNNIQLIESIHSTHFLSHFWNGDYEKAMESVSDVARS